MMSKQQNIVRVLINPSAHVDIAHLREGVVSKTVALEVDKKTATRLLAAYHYLVMED